MKDTGKLVSPAQVKKCGKRHIAKHDGAGILSDIKYHMYIAIWLRSIVFLPNPLCQSSYG